MSKRKVDDGCRSSRGLQFHVLIERKHYIRLNRKAKWNGTKVPRLKLDNGCTSSGGLEFQDPPEYRKRGEEEMLKCVMNREAD